MKLIQRSHLMNRAVVRAERPPADDYQYSPLLSLGLESPSFVCTATGGARDMPGPLLQGVPAGHLEPDLQQEASGNREAGLGAREREIRRQGYR